MFKIEIKTTEIDVFTGNSKKTGNPFSIRNQFGWIHLRDKPYPMELKIQLDDQQQPYPPGEYQVDEKSFVIDRFQNLSVGRLKLLPLHVSSKTRAA
ncbi:MAG: single-stranded DNA-binding protein [Gammaproteobacteria bacterium]|nr:single-stranded DNA-binding protein [Gammaproteobacteria bacterium]